MRTYLEVAKKAFQNNLVYRIDYIAGLINTLVMIFVNIAIWKAIYQEDEVVGGVQLKIIITYIVLGFLMQSIFAMDDYFIEGKMRTGLISSDLLKPISFRMYVFSYNIGNTAFKILMQLTPALIISVIFFHFLEPFSIQMGIFFFISSVLGFFVLYSINFLVWITSFWFYYIFSMVTIKDALIMVLSGAVIPLWFMPQWLMDFIKMTPFDSIYYIPISIYLGQIPQSEILLSILKQVLWILALTLAGHLLWKRATKKLVVQGG